MKARGNSVVPTYVGVSVVQQRETRGVVDLRIRALDAETMLKAEGPWLIRKVEFEPRRLAHHVCSSEQISVVLTGVPLPHLAIAVPEATGLDLQANVLPR